MEDKNQSFPVINYAELMQKAIHEVIREALIIVGKEGAPRNPGIYFTIDPNNKDVIIPEYLRNQEEMLLILENWFQELEVEQSGFWVTLSFNNTPERIYLPFSCIRKFLDKSANFGLEAKINQANKDFLSDKSSENTKTDDNQKVVGLDKFRKQKLQFTSHEFED